MGLSDPVERANAIGVAANLSLAVAKFVVGSMAGSAALMADGYNSAGDIVATTIGWLGYRAAQRPPDDNHHYGHGKFENVSGLIIGGLLLATGFFVSIDGLMVLASGTREAPGALAAGVAFVTVVVKEALYQYASAVGSRERSASLLASARDHRADVLISTTVAGGILGARLGVPWLDPATAVLIGGVIVWMSWEPIRENVGILLDEIPPGLAEEIRRVARGVDGVREADGIRVHPAGNEHYIELEVYIDGQLRLHDAHQLAHRVQDAIFASVPHTRDVRVHVNPTGMP